MQNKTIKFYRACCAAQAKRIRDLEQKVRDLDAKISMFNND